MTGVEIFRSGSQSFEWEMLLFLLSDLLQVLFVLSVWSNKKTEGKKINHLIQVEDDQNAQNCRLGFDFYLCWGRTQKFWRDCGGNSWTWSWFSVTYRTAQAPEWTQKKEESRERFSGAACGVSFSAENCKPWDLVVLDNDFYDFEKPTKQSLGRRIVYRTCRLRWTHMLTNCGLLLLLFCFVLLVNTRNQKRIK